MVSVAMSSGTCEAATWQGDAKTAVPMHIICCQIPYPISGWWLSNLGHLIASCTRTSSAHLLQNNLLFLQWRVERRGQRMARCTHAKHLSVFLRSTERYTLTGK
jgi:hypothetical protein